MPQSSVISKLKEGFKQLLYLCYLGILFVPVSVLLAISKALVKIGFKLKQYGGIIAISRFNNSTLRKFKDIRLMSDSFFDLARAYLGLGDHNTAFVCALAWERLGFSEKESGNAHVIYNELLGDIYKGSCDYMRAWSHYRKAQEHIDLSGAFGIVKNSDLCLKIGRVHASLGNTREAESCFSRAVSSLDRENLPSVLDRETRDLSTVVLISCHEHLGDIALSNKDYAAALKHYRDAEGYQATFKFGNYETLPQLGRIGALYREEGDYDRALSEFSRAESTHKKKIDVKAAVRSAYSLSMEVIEKIYIYGAGLAVYALLIPNVSAQLGTTITILSAFLVFKRCYKPSAQYTERLFSIGITILMLAALNLIYFSDTSKLFHIIGLGLLDDSLHENEFLVWYDLIKCMHFFYLMTGAQAVSWLGLIAGGVAAALCTSLIDIRQRQNFLTSAADVHMEIGKTYEVMGRYADALHRYRLAFECRTSSQKTAKTQVLLDILRVQFLSGSNDAPGNALQLMSDYTDFVAEVMSITSGELRRSYLYGKDDYVSLILSVLGIRCSGHTTALYDLVLHSKFINAEVAYIHYNEGLSDKQGPFRSKLERRQTLLCKKNRLLAENRASEKELSTLDSEIESIELELAPYIREIDHKKKLLEIGTQKVLGSLSRNGNAALLEYVFYKALDPTTGTQKGNYLLFLLHDGEVKSYEVGDEEEIHTLIEEALEFISSQPTERFPPPAPMTKSNALCRLYYRLIPYAVESDLLITWSHLYIAPDNELFRLPFEVLSDDKGWMLMEKVPVSYVSTGRDILRFEPGDAWTPHNAVVIADPKYRLDQSDIDETTCATDFSEDIEQLYRAYHNEETDFGNQNDLAELPATALEAEIIKTLFSTDSYTRNEAKKTVFHSIGFPDVLHITTHGFYNQRFVRIDPFLAIELILAGAQSWKERKVVPEEYGDGILSGRDVISLDLQRTNLVVLAACGSGNGTVLNGEGQQGLRRAFELAGVNTVVCTLWSIEDMASAVFMTLFYEYLAQGRGKLESLTAAKLRMRTITKPELAELPCLSENAKEFMANRLGGKLKAMAYFLPLEQTVSEQPYAHPFYWAGYILHGEV